MKVLLSGGSGHIGTILARWFQGRGDEVVILSRNPRPADWPTVPWDGQTLGPWTNQVDAADVVVNLAGRSVNCRYSPKNRQAIMHSRVDSTRVIGEAIAASSSPPRVWLQASTATIYAHRYDAAHDEFTGLLGGDEPDAPDTWRFSIDVARSWERAADEQALPNTRVVKLRSAMTMSPDRGGVFDTLLALMRRGLGGRCGDGRQYVSWIHDLDFLRAIDWIIGHDHLTGPVNLAAPNPLPNAEFMRSLRRAWGIRIGLPATRLILEIGAVFLRTETELILKSRRVVPGKLLQDGFRFEFPSWPEAAADLCRRWRDNDVGTGL